MKKTLRRPFSSKHSALVLGAGLLFSLSFAGMSFAQQLQIHSDVSNAAITVEKIFLSNGGIGTTNPPISLDGSNSKIEFRSSMVGLPGGGGASTPTITIAGNDGKVTTKNLQVDQQIKFSALNCEAGESGGGIGWTPLNPDPCILFTDAEGVVSTDGFLQTVENYSGDINTIL
jgi:hypothetical protein